MLFGLLVVLLVVAQFAATKTAGDVIRKYINAIGGSERLEELETMYMEGNGWLNEEQISIRIFRQQGNSSRTIIKRENGGLQPLNINDQDAQHSTGNITVNAADFSTETDLSGPLHGYLEKGYEAELLGKELVEGNLCYKIKLTKGGVPLLFWVDAGTYLLSQSTILPTGLSLDASKKYYTSYKNYKAVNGMLFAHSFEIHSISAPAASQVAVINFNIIRVNPGPIPTMSQSE